MFAATGAPKPAGAPKGFTAGAAAGAPKGPKPGAAAAGLTAVNCLVCKYSNSGCYTAS